MSKIRIEGDRLFRIELNRLEEQIRNICAYELGAGVETDIEALCKERGIDFTGTLISWIPISMVNSPDAITKEHYDIAIAIGQEVVAKWKTTKNFKVGDKVYVDPGKPTHAFENYIRGTITEISTDGWGYHLRAFEEDLPGIFMFNQWDYTLLPRTDKANKRLPDSYFDKIVGVNLKTGRLIIESAE